VRVPQRLRSYIAQALAQSMDVELMEKLAARVIPGYDLHERSGFPPNIPVPQASAAEQIAMDMAREGYVRRFTEVLIEVTNNGVMGRTVPVRLLPQIIKEIEALGYQFKREYGIFVEAGQGGRTKGWGIMRPETVYDLSFLRMDIAGNTELVRRHARALVTQVYDEVRQIFTGIVEKREGRLWQWEGDGGTAAFYFGAKNVEATLAGMEVLQELFMYNLLRCPFSRSVPVRLAVHTGPCQYMEDFKEIRSDTLRRLQIIESEFAEADSLVVSPGVHSDMGNKLDTFFKPIQVSRHNLLYKYKLAWE
jgi:hypothetical protein